MRPIKDISYLLLITAGATIFFAFFSLFAFIVALAVRHTSPVRYTDPWLYAPFIGAVAGFAIAVFDLRSRGLRYSATIGEFSAPSIRGSRPRPAFAEFNHANAGSLRSSLLIYLIVVIAVWTAASSIVTSSAIAFLTTLATFLVLHVIRIKQLKQLPDFSFGLVLYAGTTFVSLIAVFVVGGAFLYTMTLAAVSWKAFWLVALCFVLIACMSVHADFAIAKLLRRSTNNQ